jgi:5-(carboxyamino)imidazole ribonucleotide synthase
MDFFEVGILGSGQLSQMLIQAAPRAQVHPHVLAASKTDSAAQESGVSLTIGSISDRALVSDFLSKVSVCGFESELIDCAALRNASSGLPVRFTPQIDIMERLSEKLEQKQILKSLGIPSAPFVEGPSNESELDSWFDSLKGRLGSSFVVKWSKFGYDGRGVLLVDDEISLRKAKTSCKIALSRGVKLYAEAKVPFVRELAIIGCHSTSGDLVTYPLVISEQEHGICRRVKGPAVSLGVNARFETLAVQYAEKLAKALPLYGSFGIELFETADSDLLVNEIAPRVHNSGHYTQDACKGASDASRGSDQFENHLRAMTGQMLGRTGTKPFFGMLNLLGPQGLQKQIVGGIKALPKPPTDIFLHWYGKSELFPGRKLGHINCVADTKEELTSRMALMENYEAKWVQALKESR